MNLPVDRVQSSVGQHRRGVVDLLRPLGKPHERNQAPRVARELTQDTGRIREEMLAEQEVLGGVSGQRELGKQDQLRPTVTRGAQAGAYALGVPCDVANRGVHLTEGQPHVPAIVAAAGACSARERGAQPALAGLAAREDPRVALRGLADARAPLRTPAARASEPIAHFRSPTIDSSSGSAS